MEELSVKVRADFLINGEIIPLSYSCDETSNRIDRILDCSIADDLESVIYQCRVKDEILILKLKKNKWFILKKLK